MKNLLFTLLIFSQKNVHLNNKPTNQNDKKVQPSIGGSESFLLFTFRGKNLAENLGQDGRNLNTSIIQVLGARYGDKFFRNWGTVCLVRGGMDCCFFIAIFSVSCTQLLYAKKNSDFSCFTDF